MITKRNSLLIIVLTICVSNLSFASSNDLINSITEEVDESNSIDDRLIEKDPRSMREIRQPDLFDQKQAEILAGFNTNPRLQVQERINQRKSSWIPLFYRIAGTIFAITAGVSTIDSLLIARNAPQKMRDSLHKYSYVNEFPFNATNYLVDKPMSFISKSLNSVLSTAQEKELIGPTGFSLGKSILAAYISAWLFKSANSYQETTKKLENAFRESEEGRPQ